jgi:hypothetical protein
VINSFKILAFSLLIQLFLPNVILANNSNYYTYSQKFVLFNHKIEFQPNQSGFIIKNYPIQHQGNNLLDISVSYIPKIDTSIPSSINNKTISSELEQLLLNYPNETDFWEVINCYLTKNLLLNHPNLASITITLRVHPNQEFSYHRSTTVNQSNHGSIKESWHFDFHSDSIKQIGNELFKINVDYTYDSSPNTNYPDFIPIYKQIENFLANHITKYASWENMNQELTEMLLKKHPMISSLSVKLEKVKAE